MVRNQFYILITGIVIIILLGYSYQVYLFSKEISNYVSYYLNIARFIYTKTFLEKYQKFFYLDNSTVYPFRAIYNCSVDSIAIKNYLNLENVSVFDKKLNYLPTSFDMDYINFTVFEKKKYKDNLCIFEGYIIQNKKFTSNLKIFGFSPFFYEIYTNKKKIISKETYIQLINNILGEVIVRFDENCTEMKHFNPDIILKLNSLSLENLNLIYIKKESNILTLRIENIGKCPIDLRNFFYETDNFYKIIPNVTVNATSFIIPPGKSEIFNFSNFYNIFCLNSLGFRKCL